MTCNNYPYGNFNNANNLQGGYYYSNNNMNAPRSVGTVPAFESDTDSSDDVKIFSHPKRTSETIVLRFATQGDGM